MLAKIKTKHLLRIFFFLCIALLAVFAWSFLRSKNSPENLSDKAEAMAKTVGEYCLENANLSKGKENCYSEEFKKIAEKNGPEFSFQVLNSLQRTDRDAIGCHLISHGIGWGSFKREPNNWRTLVQNMPTICNYGAIHGVLESYILSLPEKSLSRETIPTICGETPRADCNHIVGHLLLVQTEAKVDPALDLCEVFKNNPRQNEFCISGVFMEFQTALNLIDHDLVPRSWLNWPARLDELEKMCRSYQGKQAEGCWEEIVHVALAKFNNDPKKIFDLCSSAQVPEGAKKCKRHSLGIMGASKNFYLPDLKSICMIPQKNDPGFEGECYPNMVASALSTIPTMVPDAVDFCNSLEDKFQKSCFSMIGMMSHSNPGIKEALPLACKEAPENMRNFCLGISSSMNPNDIIRSND